MFFDQSDGKSSVTMMLKNCSQVAMVMNWPSGGVARSGVELSMTRNSERLLFPDLVSVAI